MTRYLISFDDGAMTFPEEELPDVAEAAHAVARAAMDAGVWLFSGGLKDHAQASVVATDGTVTDGPYLASKQYLGGFAVVDVRVCMAISLRPRARASSRQEQRRSRCDQSNKS